MRPIAFSALLALAPAVAAADTLTDLRGTLVRLSGTTPVHGTIQITSKSQSDEEEKPDAGVARIGFEANESGLRIVYTRQLLAQADEEARAEALDPERPTVTRSGVRRVSPLHVADLVNAASALAIVLESAKLLNVHADSYQGIPSLRMTVKLTPKLSKAAAKHLKQLDTTLVVWIGNDGVPLGAEQKTHAKASFLLMSFEHDQKETWRYVRASDRLVVTRYEDVQKNDGFGQHQSSQTIETLAIE